MRRDPAKFFQKKDANGDGFLTLDEFKAGMEVSHDGNELIVSATWPEGTPETALTVELEPDGFETRSETRWSSGTELNEVLTFTW